MNRDAILAFSAALGAALLALGVARQARRSLAHWCFVAGMGLLSVESIFSGLTATALGAEQVAHWQDWRMLVAAFLPAAWLCFSLTYARGKYRETFTRWQYALAGAGLTPIVLALAFHGELFKAVVRSEPAGHWVLHLAAPGIILSLLFLVSAVLVLMNLEQTLRASVGAARWRIKFMILGLGALFVARIYTSSQMHLFGAVDVSVQSLNSVGLWLGCALIAAAFLRASPFKVDVYPSPLVLQKSLTLILAGIYLVIVGVLAKGISLWGGSVAFELKAFLILISLVLLTALSLSERLRWRLEQLVSRHFQRPLYDYRLVWRTFTEGTARRLELSDLCGAIARLVSQIFHAQSVSIWLADEGQQRLVFATSTSLSADKASLLQLDPTDAAQVIRALRRHTEPFDLDTAKDLWASALRRCHPAQFPNGGNRFAVPLVAGGEGLGVLILGDRVVGAPLSLQDLDLLQAVCEQAATSLLNLQLSQRLIQAKQLEAYQAMSAFFVHDLKNTASMLTLMLQNLPGHYEDASFREDALRGISNTTAHLNDVISRLNLLRHELAIQAVESDLNELVTETLKAHQPPPGVELVKELQPLPKVPLDPVQIGKVLTNLVLNARDALGHGGRICVETRSRNGWAVLTVTDNGCGMSPEFVQHRLFRPFQTTKKNGLGIGMFHCKLIVEAHRGLIEVETAPGQGTAFRVLLPLKSS
jgi:putative PEP-CTERM system histidine kinase